MSDGQAIFTSLEIDTIGEIMNISMGSAATAASTLLDNKVTITTPVVKQVPVEEFEVSQFAPAIAVDIRYVEGISGSNILILRKEDVRTILSLMMMTEMPDDFEIDEMAESAICELMNQMMGSSATVLSCFLGRTINISTPQTVSIERLERFKEEHFGDSKSIMTIGFTLSIKDLMESEFVSVMDVDLAKEIIEVSLNFDSSSTDEDFQTEAAAPEAAPQVQIPQASPAPPPIQNVPAGDPYMQQAPPMGQPPPMQQPPSMGQPSMQQPPPMGQPYMQQAPPMGQAGQQPYGYQQPQYNYPPQGYYPPPPQYAQPQYAPPPVTVKSYEYGDLSSPTLSPEHAANIDLVMDVPVVVTVELGRTKRKIKEILEFGQGTIVELDKQAGSQVDVIVNGQLIARGDVVVVDDNFSIRVTEILKNRESLSML